MKLTTDHPQSSYNIPIFVDNDNNTLDYADGVKAVRKALGLNTAQLGAELGVSGRTVEDWEQGRYTPSKPVLRLLTMMIDAS